MKVIDLESCDSTQLEVKRFLDNNKDFPISECLLIKTMNQTHGKGQRENSWHSFQGGIAISFTCEPNKQTQLTPIEIGIFLCQYFNDLKLDLKLKWPNDLIFKGKKVGGILCELQKGRIIAGIGINLSTDETIPDDLKNIKIPLGFLPLTKVQIDVENMIKSFLENRIGENLQNAFAIYCDHLDQEIIIDNFKGTFLGINSDGSAIIKADMETKNYYGGSISYLNSDS